MTIGIYCIVHIESSRRYIGKSLNVERRLIQHKCNLRNKTRNKKTTNSHLYNAVQSYGWKAFRTEILESFDTVDESLIAERELFWIDHFQTTCHDKGFNLRRDSSTSMIVHDETRELFKRIRKGENNPNYGHNWPDERKIRMANIKREQHKSGLIYNDDWKMKQGFNSSEFWANNPEVKKQMASKVAEKKRRYRFTQIDNLGNIVKIWDSVQEIVEENPGYKWQNIYSVCNGYKKTYMGYIWKKEPLWEK